MNFERLLLKAKEGNAVPEKEPVTQTNFHQCDCEWQIS